MNINGKNGLACITNMRDLPEPIVLKPLPGLPVIRDLIVDMTQFFKQYHSIKPYLVNDTPPPEKERLQSPEEREELNGLYECILCASCSTSCPSLLVEPRQVRRPRRPAAGLPLHRRQPRPGHRERLDNLEDPYRLFRCHTIMNCVDVCPKGLNPTKAIGKIKELMVRRAV
jgi:succinate dehydrogenase / fumarate reductase iron-sulfur subunit